jgi:hypothetical protein
VTPYWQSSDGRLVIYPISDILMACASAAGRTPSDTPARVCVRLATPENGPTRQVGDDQTGSARKPRRDCAPVDAKHLSVRARRTPTSTIPVQINTGDGLPKKRGERCPLLSEPIRVGHGSARRCRTKYAERCLLPARASRSRQSTPWRSLADFARTSRPYTSGWPSSESGPSTRRGEKPSSSGTATPVSFAANAASGSKPTTSNLSPYVLISSCRSTTGGRYA